MANYRNDPTASAALGSIDREIRAKRREARIAARMIRRGRLSAEQERVRRRRFTGIFRRFLCEELEGAA